MMTQSENPSIDIVAILDQSFKIYQKAFSSLIAISLIYGILTELVDVVFHPDAQSPLTPGTFIQFFILCWFLIMFIHSSLKLYQGQTISLKEAVYVPPSYYLTFVAVSFSEIIMSVIGFKLFIIPGLYAATVLTFANFLVVLEKTNYLDSFRRSFNLVAGYFWNVLLFNLLLATGLITILVFSQILGFGNVGIIVRLIKIFSIIVMPFIILSQVGLCLRLKDIKGSYVQ